MITMDLRVIIVLALVAPCYSWICGNRNQCVCSSNGMVSCDQISVSPLFPERSRNSRGLVLRVADPKTFDLNSLDLTHGFEFVSLTGADHDLCARVAAGFPWVTCKYDEVTSTSCVGPNCDFFGRIYTSLRAQEMSEDYEQQTSDDPGTTRRQSERQLFSSRVTTASRMDSYTMGTPVRQMTYWTVKNFGFWGTVFAGISAGLLFAVTILLILNRKCRGAEEDPACVVSACKACCKCFCVDPARKLGRCLGLSPKKGRAQYRGGSICSLESQEEYSRI